MCSPDAGRGWRQNLRDRGPNFPTSDCSLKPRQGRRGAVRSWRVNFKIFGEHFGFLGVKLENLGDLLQDLPSFKSKYQVNHKGRLTIVDHFIF